MKGTPSFHVLVVEDNAPDAELLELCFQEASECNVELTVIPDGQAASNFLFRRESYRDRKTPDLILLDLNIPRKTGLQILKELKADNELCQIPVLILTTSSSDREVRECYCIGAAAFLTKPTDLSGLENLVKTLCAFWFGQVQLSTKRAKM